MRDAFDGCLKCTLCVSQCPVMSVDPNFPGPKALGPEWYRQNQAESTDPMPYVDDCTFCQICESACPVDVPIAHLIAEQKAVNKHSLRIRIRNEVLARPHWVSRMSWLSAIPQPVRRLGKISPGIQLPTPRKSQTRSLGEALGYDPRRVGLFVDCYSRGYDQELLMRARELLRLWGFRVTLVPDGAHCCGAAAYAAGNPGLAKTSGRSLFKALTRKPAHYDMFISLNATCDGTLREEWPEFYGLDLAVPVIPFDEIADQAPDLFWEQLAGLPKASGAWITHTTCRGKVARGDGQLLELAQRAGFRDAEPSDAVCCGAGGSYAFKSEHEKTAEALVSRIREQAFSSAANGIITDSGTCAIHMEQAAAIPARHPAYWLYDRYLTYLEEGNVHETTHS